MSFSDRFEDATTTAPAPVPHTALKQEEEDMQRAIAESEAMARQQQQQQQQQQYARPSQASTSYASAPQASTSYAPAPAPAAGASAFFSQADGKNLPDVQHVPVQENATPKRPQAPSRVKALYDFEPQEDGELAFRKGDIIRVVNSAYEGWWKGELDGRIGIFPLTYIEIIPDPTPESIARDAEVEAQVFAQAGSVDRLLAMLSAADAQNSNISDDDELMVSRSALWLLKCCRGQNRNADTGMALTQELYQQCILLRPKIVKLLDKYSQKQSRSRRLCGCIRLLGRKLMCRSAPLTIVSRGPWPVARQIQGGQDCLRRDAGRELHAQQPAAPEASVRPAGQLCPAVGIRSCNFACTTSIVYCISATAAAARSSVTKLVRLLSSDCRCQRGSANVDASVLSACVAIPVKLAHQLALRTRSNSPADPQDRATRHWASNRTIRHKGSQAVLLSNAEHPQGNSRRITTSSSSRAVPRSSTTGHLAPLVQVGHQTRLRLDHIRRRMVSNSSKGTRFLEATPLVRHRISSTRATRLPARLLHQVACQFSLPKCRRRRSTATRSHSGMLHADLLYQ